jgi:hypothetical protein
MTLDDARLNFGTVVESFITERSPKGYWPLKQKTTNKILKLRLDAIEKKTVRRLTPGHFVGRATLSQVDDASPVKADFYVDFSGVNWKVEKMRLVPGRAPDKKPRQPAPPDASSPAPGAPQESAPLQPPASQP